MKLVAAHLLVICLYAWVSVVTAQVQSEYECLCNTIQKLKEPTNNQPQLLDRLELLEKQMYNFIRGNKTNSVCKCGWIRNESSCYIFEEMQNLPWENASRYCQTESGHLVRVNSLLEHNFIKDHDQLNILNFYRFWTDGNDIETEGTWVWGNSTDGWQFSVLPRPLHSITRLRPEDIQNKNKMADIKQFVNNYQGKLNCTGPNGGQLQTQSKKATASAQSWSDTEPETQKESRPCNAVQFAECVKSPGSDCDEYAVVYDDQDMLAHGHRKGSYLSNQANEHWTADMRRRVYDSEDKMLQLVARL